MYPALVLLAILSIKSQMAPWLFSKTRKIQVIVDYHVVKTIIARSTKAITIY